MLNVQRCVGLAAAVLGLMGAAMGCGDGEKPPSFGSIAKGLESPTGTVDENSAAEIGKQYEAASQNSAFGARGDNQVGQSFSGTQSCPAGGNYSASGSGNESSGSVTIDYNSCCFIEGCCASGDGTIHYNSEAASGSSSGGANYAFCATFDMQYSCEGSSASLDYSMCYGIGGEAVLLIEVNGESFAVSASTTGASGSLQIRGANGTWTCSYDDDGGSCTSTTGGSFTFTSSD